MSDKDWKFKALTNIWTGDAERKSDRLIPTDLLGSIRWWFEVVVRGLGGKACDPTSPVRCPDSSVKDPTNPGHHCVVCELFGCTGWARKFRVMVLDEQGNVIQNQIEKEAQFTLRFIPLRPIQEEEWCLLDLTLRLIADYGAIGGKTVLKPSDETNRQNAAHHKDYGLIRYISGPENWKCEKSREDLDSYVHEPRWRHAFADPAFSWASLQNFWCVKGRYLARQNANKSTFNQVIGRKEAKGSGQRLQQNNDINRWLAGSQQESKKVFSFKDSQEGRQNPQESRQEGRRTFGFVKAGTVEFDEIKGRLRQVWPDLKDNEFLTSDEIVKRLW